MMRCVLMLIIICVTFPFQIGKGNACVSQTVDKDSAIIIRTQANKHFVVRLLSGYTEEGFHIKTLLVENNNQTIADINFPSSENIKNFSVNIKKHKKGFILECFYGGGNNLYSRDFYFKCDKDSMYLYKIIGTHTTPDSDKTITERQYMQPRIDVRDFNILNYIENTP